MHRQQTALSTSPPDSAGFPILAKSCETAHLQASKKRGPSYLTVVTKSYNDREARQSYGDYMSNEVWYGIVGGAIVSIPIGILSGLAVRPVQTWLDRRVVTRSAAQLIQIRRDYAEVLRYSNDQNALTQYLIVTTLRGLIGIAVGGISFLLLLPSMFVFGAPRWRFYALFGLRIVSLAAAVTSAVFVVSWCLDAVQLWKRVRDFDDYARTVPDEVRNHVEAADLGGSGTT